MAVQKHVEDLLGEPEAPEAVVERIRDEAMNQLHEGMEAAQKEITISFAAYLEEQLQQERKEAEEAAELHKKALEQCTEATL